LYDPVSGTFVATGSVRTAADFKTATLLQNGQVLVTGGRRDGDYRAIADADLYNPATGTFSATGSMVTPRAGHVATLLPNGNVLITGGAAVTGGAATATAEVYDVASGTFALTGSMLSGRTLHTATLFPNGKVLVAGGDASFYSSSPSSNSLATAELYDPATGVFSPAAGMSGPRESQTATLLGDGSILITGGGDGTIGYAPTTVLASSERYAWH